MSGSSEHLRGWVWPTVIITAYLATALLVPYHNDLPIVDEPIYASSAFEYAETGEIVISNLSAPNSVFDTIWGGWFARVLGPSYGSLRLSTLTLVAISAPFFYLLARSVGGGRTTSTVALAAYLFNPLALTLSYTFQTDSHLLALVVISTALIAAALRHHPRRMALLASGSAVATLAYLSRPQSLLLVGVGFVSWLIWGPKGRDRWIGVAILAFPTAIAVVAHGRWVARVGEPFIREFSRQDALSRSATEHAVLLSQALILAFVYLGIFVLPMLSFLWPKKGEMRALIQRPILVATAVGLIILFGANTWGGEGFIADKTWLNDYGVGGVDRSHLGHRPPLLAPVGLALAAALTFGTSYLFLGTFAMRLPRAERDAPVKFVILMTAGFWFGTYLSSLAVHGHIVDRYWLPVLPLVLALAARTGFASSIRTLVAAGIVSLVAVFSVIAVVDAFVADRAVVEFAEELTGEGMDPLTLDAGATWSAITFGLSDRSLETFLKTRGPYWVKFYAQELRPEYAVALEPIAGYEVLERREYPSLLHHGPTYLYLVRRDPDLGFYVRPDDF